MTLSLFHESNYCGMGKEEPKQLHSNHTTISRDHVRSTSQRKRTSRETKTTFTTRRSVSRFELIISSMKIITLILTCIFFFLIPVVVNAQLRVGFYDRTCPRAESIVRSVVQKRFQSDRSITAALLRMHFHDCFVRGCDASILIDSTPKQQSEKAAGPNLTVRGFELIDEAKKTLESTCPSTVSCADVIALATRDAVALAGGLNYALPTGRRDGLTSRSTDVNLPGPASTVQQAFQSFVAKGMTLDDMVTLLGGHTVGVSHCGFFQDRLTNFQGTGKPDPTMDATLRSKLSGICSSGSGGVDPTVFLDQNTSFVVDNQFYNEILARRGVLQIDQELALDKSTAGTVNLLGSNGGLFQQRFADAMVKLGRVQVLVGNAGEIRKACNVFNRPPKN